MRTILTDAGSRATAGRRPVTAAEYRPDIDGLRAFAVLAVVAFHAAPRLLPGGFVGVDVFFVISGFLITRIVFDELTDGAFTFREFYARRIRRIFPALAVVLVATGALGWWLLTGSEFPQLQKHIAGGAFFVSNIVLWAESGYFDAPSAFKPLLHLWSLGIEEQFYLLWPPLLYLAWTRRVRVLMVILLVVGGSFALNVAVAGASAVAAFYSPATRMWELLLGGLLAYADGFRSVQVREALRRAWFNAPGPNDDRAIDNAKAWMGLGLIAVAVLVLSNSSVFPAWWANYRAARLAAGVFGLDRGIAYPGWWAVLPTVGTALLIWAGKDAAVNRAILSRRGVVYIGLISYPLYLWHWPLLAFVQITESGHPSRRLVAAAVALSLVLASLTHELVERPIRRSMSVRTPMRILAVAAVMIIVGAASLVAYATGTFRPKHVEFATALVSPITSPRNAASCKAAFPTAGEYCQQYADGLPVTTALLGDSHAEHFLPGLGEYFATRKESVVHLGESGCPPIWDVERTSAGQADTCHVANPSVLELVGRDPHITRVVLSFRGALDVDGVGYGDTEAFAVAYGIPGTSLMPDEAIRQGLGRTVDFMMKRSKKVGLILQVPELTFNIAECVGRPVSFEHAVRTPCAEPRAAVDARQARYRRVVDDVRQQFPALDVFDPLPYLCDASWCYAVRDGRMFYVDSNHLSETGSRFFATKFQFD
jgi:peptidoglycan/LPS O-acetylase OafA/YrhL